MKPFFNKKACLGIAAGLLLAVGGCKKTHDFLNLRDPLAIDADIWNQESAVQYLLNDTYQFIIPTFPYDYTLNNFALHLVSDENYYSGTENLGKKLFNMSGFLLPDEVQYTGTRYTGGEIGHNRYFDVAKANLAIKNIPPSTGLTEPQKKVLLGQFYALRGMMYLNMTKIYGGMPLVLEPQNPENLKLGGREKAKVMFAQIVKDLDSAIVNLQGVVWANDATDRGKLNQTAAAALKAKALLWWASPLFNPEGHTTYDATRWEEAFKASQAAYNTAVAAGYKLMSNYATIFQVEGRGNTEAIIVRSYSSIAHKKFHGVEARVRPGSEGGSPNDAYNPTKIMLDAYLMKDGRPITQSSAAYPYDEVLLYANRDPRFDATLAFNGSTWPLSAKPNRRQWTYAGARVDGSNESSKPFYVRKFATPNLARTAVGTANDIGGSGMDWIELRLAEVMLDYAESANEVGQTDIAKDMIRQLRKRAGIVQGTADYGLDLATDKAQMRELILNERMVELAFEGKRNDDLRRTRRMHKLQGTITQMVQMQFKTSPAGLRDSLEKAIGPNTLGIDPNLLRRDTLNIYNRSSIEKYFITPYTFNPVANNGNFSMPEHYYFFPLNTTFLNSSPLLEQTIGWDGGTFDPL
ncbi:RagB/SusD family nutrient uptake outer membrane protein [Paraflavisolibacter sp. H34]|uniref:RagB/SusD family nutrient uptake outer membrane protein n=1 Tax=Huijunlia imazamoxiresistens TaxID=3127457 RepID=UPI00301B083A